MDNGTNQWFNIIFAWFDPRMGLVEVVLVVVVVVDVMVVVVVEVLCKW